MRNRRLILIGAICLLISCTNNRFMGDEYDDILMPISNDKCFVVNVDTTNVLNHVKISSYFKNVLYIPLETKEESLVGHISQLSVKGDTLFVLDAVFSKKVHAFLKDGKHLRVIGDRGNGPNEYKSPTSIGIDNNYLYIYDVERKRILYFDLSTFEYSHSISINSSLINRYISVTDGTIYSDAYIYGATNSFLFCTLDSVSGDIVKKWLPSKLYSKNILDATYFTGDILFCETDNSIKYHNLFTDTIIKISKDNVTPYCVLKSKDLVNTDELHSLQEKYGYSISNIRNYIKGIYNIHNYVECNNYILFSYIHDNYIQTVLFNKHNQEFKIMDRLYDDITFQNWENSLPIKPILGTTNGFYAYISSMQMERFIGLIDSGQVYKSDCLSQISEDSNPILIYYYE